MVKNYKQREEDQQKRNRLYIGVFITILMVGSTLGFFVGDTQNSGSIKYEGKDGKTYKFQLVNGRYITEINKNEVLFYSHPLDIEGINISDDAANIIVNSQVLYLTFDPEAQDVEFIEQARFDLTTDMIGFGKILSIGVNKNSSQYPNLNIVTCDNATQFMPVMNFVQTNASSRIYAENNCVIFDGNRLDFLRFRDFIVYKLHGVI